MYLQVNEETLAETTKCLDDFTCLTGDSQCLGKVRYRMLGELLVVECPTLSSCWYCVPLASSHVCTCPTRKEIYNRYRV